MNSVLVDTNLLVLLIVGTADRKLIARHRRTREFTERDYDELWRYLEGYDEMWVTVHCLAETSNLLKQTNSRAVPGLLRHLAAFCAGTRESYLPKDRLVTDERFLRLGVADTGFVQKAKRVDCSITVDLDLYLAIEELGRKVVNFNHIRASYLVS